MSMDLHRVEELLQLLHPVWNKQPELNLVQMLEVVAKRAGFDKPLSELSDDVLIYQLKMWDADKSALIPGIAKDYHEDFKTAMLKERGILPKD